MDELRDGGQVKHREDYGVEGSESPASEMIPDY